MSETRPLDIAHVVAPARAGGLERVVEMLAVGHAKRGHRVSAFALVPVGWSEPPLLDRLREQGIGVTVLPVAGRAYRAERRQFAEALSRQPRGILHTHGYRADVVYGSVGARLGFSTVTTLHGFTGGDLKNRVYEYVQRFSVRRFDAIVAVSAPIEALMRRAGVRADRLHRVPNAFATGRALASRAEARARLGVEGDRFLVGWVGRLSREKGADVLVNALVHLRDTPVTVVVVGDGAEGERLRAQAEALGVTSMVRWLGTVDDAGSLFHGLDALAMSSRTEGTPIVLFEAMAAQVPVVATAVGGIPDVVSSAEALLVPSEDPRALADAIRAVVDDRAGAAARAARAIDVLSARYAIEPWLDRYESVYAAALR